MTVEIFLVVVLLLVVKYTLEFGDRTTSPLMRRVRRLRPRRRRRHVAREPVAPPAAQPLVAQSPPAETAAAGRDAALLDTLVAKYGTYTDREGWAAELRSLAALTDRGVPPDRALIERIEGLEEVLRRTEAQTSTDAANPTA